MKYLITILAALCAMCAFADNPKIVSLVLEATATPAVEESWAQDIWVQENETISWRLRISNGTEASPSLAGTISYYLENQVSGEVFETQSEPISSGINSAPYTQTLSWTWDSVPEEDSPYKLNCQITLTDGNVLLPESTVNKKVVRIHSGAQKALGENKTVGVRADIVIRWGKVTHAKNFSAAWLGLHTSNPNHDPGSKKKDQYPIQWIQAGFSKKPNVHRVYLEACDGRPKVRAGYEITFVQLANPGNSEGKKGIFLVQVLPNGNIMGGMSLNGQNYLPAAIAPNSVNLKGRTFDQLGLKGEIMNNTSADMPGTVNAKCVFSLYQILLNNNWNNVAIANADLTGNNAQQGSALVNNTIEIWDKQLLP